MALTLQSAKCPWYILLALGSQDESPSRTLRKIQHEHFTLEGPALPSFWGSGLAGLWREGQTPAYTFDTHAYTFLDSHTGTAGQRGICALSPFPCPHEHSSVLVIGET